MKQDLPKHLRLRRMGESLYLTIPKEFARAHTLGRHDYVFWQPVEGRVILEFDHAKVPQHSEEAA